MVAILLGLVHRRVFVHVLALEYLGYSTLFSEIFSWLGMAELGVGTIITFHLYRELASQNHEEISKLMVIYKWVYWCTGAVVLAAGAVLSLFLPAFVRDATISHRFMLLIYYLQLSGILVQYFLSYRRTIFVADQREYLCAQLDIYCSLGVQLVRCVCLLIFRNFLLDLALGILVNLLTNLLIHRLSRRVYPYLDETRPRVTLQDIKDRDLFRDTANFLIHRLSYTVYGATDNIIISAACGIRQVALYGNYTVLYTSAFSIFYKIMGPVQAAIGNRVYAEREMEDQWNLFRAFDILCLYLAQYGGLGFLVFYQPVITLWMGEGYLLDGSLVAVTSLLAYSGIAFEIVYSYRAAFGDYRQDRACMMLSAVLNVALSVLLVRVWDVTGVKLGTLAALLPILYGRSHFVIKGFFHKSLPGYLARQTVRGCVFLGEMAAVWALTSGLPVSAAGLALRFAVWAVVPGAAATLLACRETAFHLFISCLQAVFRTVSGKLRRLTGR
ncbi:hypothetical protein [uncultured Oscillibacter sp.]|uniref:lipopolysaccharide biosynthesis protein n=1 Tax=uncultured Oscillibacter sp. TaxID=876091 RepID=UPI002D7FC52E|nr:hypothetical protein [uncultured Oscillibacter sp.]